MKNGVCLTRHGTLSGCVWKVLPITKSEDSSRGSRPGTARIGVSWQGEADKVRSGVAGLGLVRYGEARQVWNGSARWDRVWTGKTRQARPGTVWMGMDG